MCCEFYSIVNLLLRQFVKLPDKTVGQESENSYPPVTLRQFYPRHWLPATILPDSTPKKGDNPTLGQSYLYF